MQTHQRVSYVFAGSKTRLLTDMTYIAQDLKFQGEDTRVLLLSGYTEATDPRGSPVADADFLQKPFSTDTLARRVREILDAPVRPT